MLADSVATVQNIVKSSTEGVDRKIHEGVKKIELGVKLTERCESVLNQVVDNISHVTEIMQELCAGASEQSEGVKNITIAMQQIDETTSVNADIAEQTLAYAQNLSEQANELASAVHALESEVVGSKFSQQIKTDDPRRQPLSRSPQLKRDAIDHDPSDSEPLEKAV